VVSHDDANMNIGKPHIALVGFMGAGKTSIGFELARLLERPFVDADVELERRHGLTIPQMFEQHGEPWFRNAESELLRALLDRHEPSVVALGGGAVTLPDVREALADRAFTVLLHIDAGEAWQRVSATNRPLARDESEFRRLYEQRRPLYTEVADAVATDLDGTLLALGGIVAEHGAIGRLDELVPGDGGIALIADERVVELHRPALGARLVSTHTVPAGEPAKTLAVCERLWDELGVDRSGTVVAVGGGAATDVAGFVAATYLRGIAWVPVPSTIVGQVDAAIGGKTAIDLQRGKNLVGSFHLPATVVIDPDLLRTLPSRERQAGMSEVVKTGLLAGRELWTLPDSDMVRACAAFKTAVCIADPHESGRRAILNLGHTFAHGLEAAGAYHSIAHGEAVALGLRAALRLSIRHLGLDPAVLAEVEETLPAALAAVDLETAWAAMAHDKKARAGRLRLVLLRAPGEPVYGVELPDEEIRAELAALLAA
jgi:3-dehydroquinate synthetase